MDILPRCRGVLKAQSVAATSAPRHTSSRILASSSSSPAQRWSAVCCPYDNMTALTSAPLSMLATSSSTESSMFTVAGRDGNPSDSTELRSDKAELSTTAHLRPSSRRNGLAFENTRGHCLCVRSFPSSRPFPQAQRISGAPPWRPLPSSPQCAPLSRSFRAKVRVECQLIPSCRKPTA